MHIGRSDSVIAPITLQVYSWSNRAEDKQLLGMQISRTIEFSDSFNDAEFGENIVHFRPIALDRYLREIRWAPI